MELTAVFTRVPEGYTAYVAELPGANTQGATLEEARKNLHEAVRMVLEANRELAESKLACQGSFKEFVPGYPRQVQLEWKLAPAITESTALHDICKMIDGTGLYMVNDSPYSHRADSLVYIGKSESKDIGKEIVFTNNKSNSKWIENGQTPAIRYARLKPTDPIEDCETLLIWVHQPIYNSRGKNSQDGRPPLLRRGDLVIHNVGDFGRLLPVVTSNYPWFRFQIPMFRPGEGKQGELP